MRITAAITLASFAWAALFYFRPVRRWTAQKVAFDLSAIAVFSWASWQVAWAVPSIAGSAFFAVALALFWATVASHDRPPGIALGGHPAPALLVHHGAYRVGAHPFYASYALYLAGCVAAVPATWPALGIMAAWFLYVAHGEEVAAC
jgi:hypothetical protein